MTLAVGVFFCLLVICGGIWIATASYNRRRVAKARPWSLEEHSDGKVLSVFATRPGNKPFLIGSISWNVPDFEYQIEEVRSEGRQKLAALNSKSLSLGT